MKKIQFENGTKVSNAKVTIDGVDYPVTPARYSGATPLSAYVMNKLQDNIETGINEVLQVATTTNNGLMSASDKSKLDNLVFKDITNQLKIKDNTLIKQLSGQAIKFNNIIILNITFRTLKDVLEYKVLYTGVPSTNYAIPILAYVFSEGNVNNMLFIDTDGTIKNRTRLKANTNYSISCVYFIK